MYISKLAHAVLTSDIIELNSDNIHSSSIFSVLGVVSRSIGISNCEANLATLNSLVNTPKYFFSISSGLIWKSSPTCASHAFHNLKHSLPILFAFRLTVFSGPLTFHEPVRPPAPHSSTESASIPLPNDLLIFLPQGSIPRPSIQTCLNPGLSSRRADFSRV